MITLGSLLRSRRTRTSERHRRLETALRHTLTNDVDSIRIVFQPIVDLTADRDIICFEALVRWRGLDDHEESPDEFVPLAERSGLITRLDRHVLATATREFAARPWTSGLFLSINLSRHAMRAPQTVDDVRTALTSSGLDPRRLCIEITETASGIDVDTMTPVVTGLRELGVQVALDDFGRGQASPHDLATLPVTHLKTDRSLLGDRGSAVQALSRVVALAAEQHVDVVVAGVETAAQEEIVKASGCRLAQGYRYGRPSPLDDFRDRIPS